MQYFFARDHTLSVKCKVDLGVLGRIYGLSNVYIGWLDNKSPTALTHRGNHFSDFPHSLHVVIVQLCRGERRPEH